ncbi:hypothetical protein EVJ50_05465 [Synechococcus sp. RSCCF101]|uniref:tetratricopeptide repeat protein n=1 Tax=Synechococcus sp. RSCCF101 TaxID=2511069 RepID=UPI0012489F5D|nr:hypothetical protein [Synechococcus sp. RSCCF101]QEY31778.1 hypothetical protein EVJ50_05465 [Synechococcus sp. RSCCF101]
MRKDTLLEAIRRFPDDVSMLQRLGSPLEAEGNWDEIRSIFQDHLKRVSRHSLAEAYVTYLLAKVCLEAGEHRQALTLSSRSLRSREDFAYTHHIRGRSLAALGQMEEAMQAQRRCLELAPDFAWGWYELGRLQARDVGFREATGSFRTAIELESARGGSQAELFRSALADLRSSLEREERHAACRRLWPDRDPTDFDAARSSLTELEIAVERFQLMLERTAAPADLNPGAQSQ